MKWDWPGAVVLVLAIAIGVGWVCALVIALIDQTDGNELLAAATGAMVGAVLGWLVGQGRNGGNRNE